LKGKTLMAETGDQPMNVLLSRDELLLMLQLLRAPTLAGLDANPAGDWNAEQQRVALTVAERALRARDLAHLRPGGELAVHTALLAAVGVCAYPQATLFVYHWPANAEAATRYFAHQRQGELVAHTRPADVLHLFTRLPSPAALVTQLFTACGWEEVPTGASQQFTLPAPLFADVRRLAMSGEVAGALDLLRPQRIAIESARPFVMTLAEAPRLSVVQMRKQGNGGVQALDLTLVQNSQRSWLVTNGVNNDPDTLAVKTTTRAEVTALFTNWLQ
jgi:hypothetical protein